eukprot:m51a1_g192 putative fe-only (1742) ;mRNA; f:610757-618790
MSFLRKRERDAGPPPPDYLPEQREVKPPNVNVWVDGREVTVPSSWSVLRACRYAGARVPSLCHHPALNPSGRCGVCVVCIEDGKSSLFVLSCKTVVEAGMRITTQSPEVMHQAQSNLHEFLGGRTLESLLQSGRRAPEIEDLIKFVRSEPIVPEGRREHAVVRDQSLCISCTRCVRACSNIQAMDILSINTGNPAQPIVFEGNLPLHATNCIACGQCTVVCPTGAVRERSDVAAVMNEFLWMPEPEERRTMIVMTAPSARISLGEMMGDEPGTTDVGTVVAALHAAGFDLVFDTTVGADMTATLEAVELIERLKSNGPLPMFTSCCPAWKYPHLRKHLSRCKSPMMMLGAMIRHWMEQRGVPRQNYVVVAMMPCTAKKEEILRHEYLAPDGTQDVDFVLTVREMGSFLDQRGVVWGSLPGEHKPAYDEPFCSASGGGSLFAVSGGVMEAALRVAYTVLNKEEDVPQTKESLFDIIDIAVISGSKSIMNFLESQHLSDAQRAQERSGPVVHVKHFVECMACPGGCIGGGGQPQSTDELVLEKRRAAVYRISKASKHSAPIAEQRTYIETTLKDITSDLAKSLLEYEHQLEELSTETVILYGSQSGDTALRAKLLAEFLSMSLPDKITLLPMDSFPFEKLPQVSTLIIVSSTWEGETGFYPNNAQEFYKRLVHIDHSLLNTMLLTTKFAVCGFGSSRYPNFCRFAVDLHILLNSLGGYPVMNLTTVDVERPNKGKKFFTKWMRNLALALKREELPDPNYLVVPSVVSAAKSSCGLQAGEDVHILPANPKADVESLINAIYPNMLNTSVTLVPLSTAFKSQIPPHLTIRQLFEQFIDLSHKPTMWFVEKMEALLHEANDDTPPLCPALKDTRLFRSWAADKTYASVLKMYKAVVPPMEILLSMVPLTQTRAYTPIHLDPPRPNTLAICVRMHGGHCSNFLIGLKKGDEDVLTFGCGERRLPVCEEVVETFDISNMTKEKVRFTITSPQSDKFRVVFEPQFGVIKPSYVVTVRATVMCLCTTSVTDMVSISCELVNRKPDESQSTPKIKNPPKAELQCFQRECETLSNLRCPYIVAFVGYCEQPGKLALVTEFHPLGSLARYCHDPALSTLFKFKALINCARGVSFLHSCGIMHRDLKPDNLLVVTLEDSAPIVCKIADFAPVYMAPEMLLGADCSPSADVFSFGVVMWELFTGLRPYCTPDFERSYHHVAMWRSRLSRLSPLPQGIPLKKLLPVLLILFLEGFTSSSINSYAGYMVVDIGPTSDPNRVGFYAGLLTCCFFAAQFVSSYPIGALSDRVGRRPVLLVGTAGIMLSQVAFGFSWTLAAALAFRSLNGILNGNVGTAKTYLAELTDASNRVKTFSFIGLMFGLGSVVGAGVGGLTARPAIQYPSLFSKSGIFGRFPYLLPNLVVVFIIFIALVLSYFFLEETLPKKSLGTAPKAVESEEQERDCEQGAEMSAVVPGKGPEEAEKSDNQDEVPLVSDADKANRAAIEPPSRCSKENLELWKYPLLTVATYGSVAIVQATIFATIPLWAIATKSHGGLGFKPAQVGLINTISGAGCVISQLFIGPTMLRKFKILPTMRMCCVALVPVLFLFPVVSITVHKRWATWLVLSVLLVAWQSFSQTMFNATNVLMANSVEPRKMGTLNGIGQSAASLVRTVLPALCGLLTNFAFSGDHEFPFNHFLPFFVSSAASLGLLCVTLLLPSSLNSAKGASQAASIPEASEAPVSSPEAVSNSRSDRSEL